MSLPSVTRRIIQYSDDKIAKRIQQIQITIIIRSGAFSNRNSVRNLLRSTRYLLFPLHVR